MPFVGTEELVGTKLATVATPVSVAVDPVNPVVDTAPLKLAVDPPMFPVTVNAPGIETLGVAVFMADMRIDGFAP